MIRGAFPLIEVAAAVDFAAADEVFVAACGGKAALEATFDAGIQHLYQGSCVHLFAVFCHVVCFLTLNPGGYLRQPK